MADEKDEELSEEEQEQLKELLGQGDYGYPKPPSKDTISAKPLRNSSKHIKIKLLI